VNYHHDGPNNHLESPHVNEMRHFRNHTCSVKRVSERVGVAYNGGLGGIRVLASHATSGGLGVCVQTRAWGRYGMNDAGGYEGKEFEANPRGRVMLGETCQRERGAMNAKPAQTGCMYGMHTCTALALHQVESEAPWLENRRVCLVRGLRLGRRRRRPTSGDDDSNLCRARALPRNSVGS
jgi:hypothetical protein